eukprot:473313-Prymnesium_polylepis.2
MAGQAELLRRKWAALEARATAGQRTPMPHGGASVARHRRAANPNAARRRIRRALPPGSEPQCRTAANPSLLRSVPG